MEFARVVRRRRMVRRYDPDRPVPEALVRACLANAIRAPSAGFTQGWDFLVLSTPEQRATFWGATTDPDAPVDSWLAGVRTAPVLVLCLADRQAYLDRYAEPDKGASDRSEARWPVPYWDVDTGMAALLIMLTAVDLGLGALFFGVPATRHTGVLSVFGVPPARRIVGVVSLGYAVPHPPGASLRRGRREVDEVAHWGRWAARPQDPGAGR